MWRFSEIYVCLQFFFPFICAYLTLYAFVIYPSLHGGLVFGLWLYYFYFSFIIVDVRLYLCIFIYSVKKSNKTKQKKSQFFLVKSIPFTGSNIICWKQFLLIEVISFNGSHCFKWKLFLSVVVLIFLWKPFFLMNRCCFTGTQTFF